MTIAGVVRLNMLDISLVVPFKDNVNFTKQFLSTYREFCPAVSEILLINNQSSDEVVNELQKFVKDFDEVKIIEFNQEFNYQKIINFGVGNAKNKIIGVFNNDIEFFEKSTNLFQKAYDLCSLNSTGVVGCLMYYGDLLTVQHNGVELNEFFWGANSDSGELEDSGVFALSGAVHFFDKSKFNSVGKMNEIFEVDTGDVDLCHQFNKKYKNHIIRSSSVIHHESQTRELNNFSSNDLINSYRLYSNVSGGTSFEYSKVESISLIAKMTKEYEKIAVIGSRLKDHSTFLKLIATNKITLVNFLGQQDDGLLIKLQDLGVDVFQAEVEAYKNHLTLLINPKAQVYVTEVALVKELSLLTELTPKVLGEEKQRVLITNRDMTFFRGSEVTVIELAQYFLQNDFDVEIYSRKLEHVAKAKLLELGVYHTTDQNQLSSIYDIAWIHHNVIPEKLLRFPFGVKFVFYHMSFYEINEFPIFYEIEKEIASLFLTNSEDVKDNLSKTYPLDYKIFGNPAPDEFLSEQAELPDVKRIALISNHVPEEMSDACELLEGKEFEVVKFGLKDPKQKMLNSELLNKFDLIISIGKTVQYSILANKPIYVYDHFGGCGFLTPENFEKARYNNFSGRGFTRKTTEHIVEEIEGYSKETHENYVKLCTKNKKDFTLSESMREILSQIKTLESSNMERKDLDQRELNKYFVFSRLLNDEINLTKHFIKKYEEEKASVIAVHSTSLKDKVLESLPLGIKKFLQRVKRYINGIRAFRR